MRIKLENYRERFLASSLSVSLPEKVKIFLLHSYQETCFAKPVLAE